MAIRSLKPLNRVLARQPRPRAGEQPATRAADFWPRQVLPSGGEGLLGTHAGGECPVSANFRPDGPDGPIDQGTADPDRPKEPALAGRLKAAHARLLVEHRGQRALARTARDQRRLTLDGIAPEARGEHLYPETGEREHGDDEQPPPWSGA